MGNLCEHQSESFHSHQDISQIIEEERHCYTKKNTKVSNLSTGSETTKSRNTDLGQRRKISKMRKPSEKIFTVRRPEFSEPIFDPLLTEKYKKVPLMGPLLLEDQSTYEGQLKHRLRYGFGELVTAEGAMYEGYWDNDKRNGLGRYFMDSGQVYDGCWANDKMHGQGRLYISDSEYYEGSFEDGMKSGLGKYFLPDGSYYEGTWYQDRRVGEGWFYSAANKTKTLQIWSLDSTQ